MTVAAISILALVWAVILLVPAWRAPRWLIWLVYALACVGVTLAMLALAS